MAPPLNSLQRQRAGEEEEDELEGEEGGAADTDDG